MVRGNVHRILYKKIGKSEITLHSPKIRVKVNVFVYTNWRLKVLMKISRENLFSDLTKALEFINSSEH
jgi:hypothetical protein